MKKCPCLCPWLQTCLQKSLQTCLNMFCQIFLQPCVHRWYTYSDIHVYMFTAMLTSLFTHMGHLLHDWHPIGNFPKTCSVSPQLKHSCITSLGSGWFHSSIYELPTGSCTKNSGVVSGKYLKFKFFFVNKLGGGGEKTALFFMKYHNAHKYFPYFIDQPQKMLRRDTF